MASNGTTPSRMTRSGSSSRLTQLGGSAALPGQPSVAGVALASGLFLSCILSLLFVAGLQSRNLISNEKPTTWSALGAPDRCSANELSSLSNDTASGAGCGGEQSQEDPESSQVGARTKQAQQIGSLPKEEHSEPSEEGVNAAARSGDQTHLASASSTNSLEAMADLETAGNRRGALMGSKLTHPGSERDFKFHPVPITVLPDTETSGLCLDGSPPAYHLRRGWGTGITKWVVFLEGGGWCSGPADCRKRSRSPLGSSRLMNPEALFGGILSNSSYWNPYLHDWNCVFVRYCDGSSFSGTAGHKDGVRVDGQNVFERVVRHLLQVEGMRHATHALLAGCSAGGLAALLHCDQFKSLLVAGSSGLETQEGPIAASRDLVSRAQWSETEQSESRGRRLAEGPRDKGAVEEEDLGMGRREQRKEEGPVVKCLSDGGFFPDIEDVMGRRTLRKMYAGVVAFHRPLLSRQCMEATGAGDSSPACFFAENFIKFIETPTFVLNPLYDIWLIRNAAIPWGDGLPEQWLPCRDDIRKCSEEHLSFLHSTRSTVIDKVGSLLDLTSEASREGRKPRHGAFLDSCRTHCQAVQTLRWNGPGAPMVNNRTMAQAVASWYKEDDEAMASYDCPYPCNPTCYPNALHY